MQPKITLFAWACARYAPPPSIATLRRWAREAHIWPQPEMVGRMWYVETDARYIRKPVVQVKQPMQMRLVA